MSSQNPGNPEVSIIIVTYNSEADIGACLNSIAQDRWRKSREIVVVDNGSTDNTCELVSRNHANIKLLRNSNTGYGSGCNLGAEFAQGDILVFLNPDTCVKPDWLTLLTKDIVNDRQITTPAIYIKNTSLLNTLGNSLHFSGFGFVNGYNLPAAVHGTASKKIGISGCCFALSRLAFKNLGGFDTDFFLYMEDVELSWRACSLGYNIEPTPDSIIEHDYELSVTAKKLYYLEFGRWLLLRKHYHPAAWMLLWPSLLVGELLAWSYAASLGLSGLNAKIRAMRESFSVLTDYQSPATMPISLAARPITPMIPFPTVSKSRFVLAVGALVNLLFRLNWALYTRFYKAPKTS